MEHEGWFEAAELAVGRGVDWLRLGVETIGAVVILVGVILAAYRFFHAVRLGTRRGYADLRLTLARYLAVALEFQLAADILSTAIAPTWDRIGKLAAVAVIRTGLNYFLAKEMEMEEKHLALEREAAGGAPV
jgi:uncharacterized membrane protein